MPEPIMTPRKIRRPLRVMSLSKQAVVIGSVSLRLHPRLHNLVQNVSPHRGHVLNMCDIASIFMFLLGRAVADKARGEFIKAAEGNWLRQLGIFKDAWRGDRTHSRYSPLALRLVL